MPKRLQSDHAEDVGGAIVEPGDAIPKGADDEVVARLEDEGKIADDSAKKSDKGD